MSKTDNINVQDEMQADGQGPAAIAEPNRRPTAYVDPRVAEGAARASLDCLVDPDIAHRSLRKATSKLAPLAIHLRSVSRREFRRHVERRILPVLMRQRVYSRLVETTAALELRSLSIYGNATEGMLGLEHISSNLSPAPRIEEVALIRPHALARCLQRNGVTDHRVIRREISAAMVLCTHLAPIAASEGWKQLAVPTENGVFLGFVDGDGLLVLCTYIRPGQNDRGSRWDTLLREFGPVPIKSVVSIEKESLEFCEALIRRLTSCGPLADRFPALRQPYRPRQDALDVKWTAARNASLA